MYEQMKVPLWNYYIIQLMLIAIFSYRMKVILMEAMDWIWNDVQLKRKLSISLENFTPIFILFFRYSLLYDSHITSGTNLSSHEWSDYISPAKRPHHSLMLSSALPHLINHPSLFEYQANGIHSHQEQQMVSRCLYMFGFPSFYTLLFLI